jgi:hypothetical protein
MNPLVSKLLTGLLRQSLTGVAGWLIARGILTQADVSQLIAGLVMGLGSLAWALYTRYKDHLTLLTALASPSGSSIDDVKAVLKKGATVSPTTPSNAAPKIIALFVAAAVGLGAMTVSSCGGNPQVQLLHGSQSITAGLQSFQQIENALCGVDAAKPTHCDQVYPGVTAAQLDSAHQGIERAIGKFATDKIAFDGAAAAWQPGQGAPTSLSALTADITLITTTLQNLPAGTPTSGALSQINSVLTLITDLVNSLQGK